MTTPTNQGATYLPTAGEGKVAQFPGVYAGTVVNNADPLGVGRLLLFVPQVLGNTVSPWAVPAGTYFTIPSNNTPVSVTFLGGDPSQPLWNGPLDLSPVVEAAAAPTVTYSSTQPSNPKVGDVWYQLIGGAQQAPQVWTFFPMTSTYGWVTQPSLGAAALAADSVLSGTIAAGALDGKVINGNIINGAVINGAEINAIAGANNGLFLYATGVPAFKQQFINNSIFPPVGTSTSWTIVSATAAGSALLISVGIGSATTDLVTSVTDSKGNTYTRVNTEAGTSQGRGYQYLALNSTALTTSDTIVVHYSSAPSSYTHIQGIECVNVATSSAVDTATVGNGPAGGGAASVATGAMAAAPELVIGSWSASGGAPFITDAVFSTAATQAGQITTYVTSSATTSLTNSVLFSLGGGTLALTGCVVSLKGVGTPVLLGTGAAVAGTDQYTNAFKEGFTVYHSAAHIQMHVNSSYGASGAPALEFVTGASSEQTSAAMFTAVVNAGLVNESITTYLFGPASTHDTENTWIQLTSAAHDGSSTAGGVIYMYNGTTFTPISFWGTGGFKTLGPLDGNTYTPGHLVVQGTMTLGSPQTISAVVGAPATLSGMGSIAVGVGSYRIRSHIQFQANQSAGSPNFTIVLSGGATASKQWGTGVYYPSGGTTVGTNARTASLLFTGPVMVSGTEYGVLIDAIVTFSAGGFISLEAYTGTAGDTFAVHNAYIELSPV